jgi:hypothetical protein
MIVKIERYFKYPNIRRQTPNVSMVWKDMVFTEEDIPECDYLVILDKPGKDISIKVNKDNIIHLCLEPPNEVSKYRQYANTNAGIIFNQLDIKRNNILSHGALPWHINKNYDELTQCTPELLKKDNKIVWITSNQNTSKGHNERMKFLERIKPLPCMEIKGRGFEEVEDKWDVLSKSKYAIAYENFQNDYYWTEKIADCFLSYTLPLYFGCNRISDFFPEKSFIQIDPKDKHIELFLSELVTSRKWEQNIDAIIEARNLVLNRYQLFPFIYSAIENRKNSKGHHQLKRKEQIHLSANEDYFDNTPFNVVLEKYYHKYLRMIKSKYS